MSETLHDIVAEMREIRVREFQDFADRIEAAAKRGCGNAAAMREALENANEHAGKIMAITTIPELYAKSIEVIRHHAVEIGFIAAETLAEGDDNASK